MSRSLEALPGICLGKIEYSTPRTPSLFEGDMPYSLPIRDYRRKWWEWEYIAHQAEIYGCLRSDKTALGLGVGAEALIFFFAKYCGKVIATDLYSGSTAWREARYDDFAREILSQSPIEIDESRITITNADMRDIPLDESSVDLVWSTSSIEHVPTFSDVLRTFSEMIRVLRPGGYCIVTTEFCLSDPPYLLPGVNALDKQILPALLDHLSSHLEVVGARDLSFEWWDPTNGPAPRRYAYEDAVSYLHGVRNLSSSGHMANPLGLSVCVPVALTLRRTPEVSKLNVSLEDLKLSEHVLLYCKGMDAYHKGDNEATTKLMSAAVHAPEASLQLKLHALRFGVDAEIRSGLSQEQAAEKLKILLSSLPPRAFRDNDCGDFFSYILREAGFKTMAGEIALAASSSPSCTFDHAIRMACRLYTCDPQARDHVVAVIVDLVVHGLSPTIALEEFEKAATDEGISEEARSNLARDVRRRLQERVDALAAHIESGSRQDAFMKVSTSQRT